MIQFSYSKKNKLTTLFAKLEFGAAALSSCVADDAVITREAAGEYKIALKNKLFDFLGAGHVFHGAVIDGMIVHVKSFDMSTGEIIINTLAAGVATDPTTGAKLMLELKFNNSSVK